MNFLKTPHQKILEEAGASPLPSPGMLNTPKQMLFQEAGVLPKYAEGKSVDAMKDEIAKSGKQSMVFNIGKNIGDQKNAISHAQILEAMRNAGLDPEHAHVVFAQPDKTFGPFEDTLVVKAKGNPHTIAATTHSLAESLNQDAIPVKFHGGDHGMLVGPKAQAWGNAFNPDYFIEHGKTTAAGNAPAVSETIKAVSTKNPTVGAVARDVVGRLAAPMIANAPAIVDRGIEMSKGKDIGENLAGLALDVAPYTPATVAAGLMRPTDMGDATLDAWNKQKDAEKQAYLDKLHSTSPVFKQPYNPYPIK